MRAYDKNSDGKLDIHEVYGLMVDFQKEQKKALTLRYVVISLSIFAVLLCLANIGTSFAAATLAKDTRNDNNIVLVDKSTGDVLGISQMDEVFDVRLATALWELMIKCYAGSCLTFYFSI